MRRKNRRNIKDKNINTKKALYISGSILVVAIIGFIITFIVYRNRINNISLGELNTSIVDSYEESTEEASSEMGKTVNEVESEMEDDEENEENEIEENTTKYAVNTSNAETNTTSNSADASSSSSLANTTNAETETTEEEEEEDPTFQMPVSGEIIREYAQDSLVYSATLDEWVTHNGIDIAAEKTTVVKASADGTVKSIKNDPRYGLTVVIEHTNGYETVYSNLLTAEFVVEGEEVKQGQTIGTVGATATFEISDEAHLHFEIKKDGEYLDPELHLEDLD